MGMRLIWKICLSLLFHREAQLGVLTSSQEFHQIYSNHKDNNDASQIEKLLKLYYFLLTFCKTIVTLQQESDQFLRNKIFQTLLFPIRNISDRNYELIEVEPTIRGLHMGYFKNWPPIVWFSFYD